MSQITAEILEVMKAQAPLNMEKAEAIAIQFDLKPRSVIASAVRNKIEYTKKARVSKAGGEVVSKEQLVARIAEKYGFELDQLAGLDKANKSALEVLVG